MQTLLILYLSDYLFLPENSAHVWGFQELRSGIESVTGPRSPEQLASIVFGLYAGLVYLLPIFGGLLADRWIGRTRSVVIGAIAMAMGHFLMAFESSLLPALTLLVLGVAAFKGNIAVQVSDLFKEGDPRRATAFQIFILSVQAAAIIAPLVCGTLGEKVAWHWGFGAAGFGMLIGLAVYIQGLKYLPRDRLERGRGRTAGPRLTQAEKSRLAILFLMMPVLTVSIVGYGQFGNAFPLWSRGNMDMVVAGFAVPLTWLQAVDGVCRLASMVAAIWFWRWWDTKYKPINDLLKISCACLVAASAPALLMIPAFLIEHGGDKVSILWTVAYSLVNAMAFATLVPVGLALYAHASPRRLQGFMIGIYFLHIFVGNILVGWLAGFLSEMSGTSFWGLHAILVATAGGVLLVINLMFSKIFKPAPPPVHVSLDKRGISGERTPV
ncbi:hypothetical protein ASD88_10220 [Pelomonas sp. Root662]|nr:hypothetical protein ASC81_10220 [Pelomonas sp. Root405]KRA72148.1 hypothetical protein ASD88_10220 [Pelomonas sp. Root662]